MADKRLPIDLHSAERPAGDRVPTEPLTEPRLPADYDYRFAGSAGGEVARLRADRDRWKERALKAEEMLRRFIGQDCDAKTNSQSAEPARGDDIVYRPEDHDP